MDIVNMIKSILFTMAKSFNEVQLDNASSVHDEKARGILYDAPFVSPSVRASVRCLSGPYILNCMISYLSALCREWNLEQKSPRSRSHIKMVFNHTILFRFLSISHEPQETLRWNFICIITNNGWCVAKHVFSRVTQ